MSKYPMAFIKRLALKPPPHYRRRAPEVWRSLLAGTLSLCLAVQAFGYDTALGSPGRATVSRPSAVFQEQALAGRLFLLGGTVIAPVTRVVGNFRRTVAIGWVAVKRSNKVWKWHGWSLGLAATVALGVGLTTFGSWGVGWMVLSVGLFVVQICARSYSRFKGDIYPVLPLALIFGLPIAFASLMGARQEVQLYLPSPIELPKVHLPPRTPQPSESESKSGSMPDMPKLAGYIRSLLDDHNVIDSASQINLFLEEHPTALQPSQLGIDWADVHEVLRVVVFWYGYLDIKNVLPGFL